MLHNLRLYLLTDKKKILFFLVALCMSVLVGGSVVKYGWFGPLFIIAIVAVIAFVLVSVRRPKNVFWIYLGYCFVLGFLVKSFPNVPVGLAMEALLLSVWAGIVINRQNFDWSRIKNEHVLLSTLWFLISFIQILNPNAGSSTAWFNELRFTALSWLLIAPLVFVLLNKNKDLNKFIGFIVIFSAIATLYGAKQLYLGVNASEQRWLDGGANETHILKGQFRAFSMYSDAGQFGASQAILAVITFVLALGPFKFKYRILMWLATFVFLYGMGISGTRGALFGLVAGLGYSLFLSKNFKLLLVACFFALGGLGMLKYTNIGDDIFQIHRLRSALNPNDESFKVRLLNQQKLEGFLKEMPFGAGLGMSGTNGVIYNSDKPIAVIPPDSYWVKVWVMYGVVGLLVWIAIVAYLIGKCSGIIWRIKDPQLKTKLIALTSGTVGCFISSYGNEVMNGIPSSMILFISWSFVMLGPYLDEQLANNKSVCP
jgi:hypothetical protein